MDKMLQRFRRCGGEWDMRGQKLCGTFGLYFPRPRKLQERYSQSCLLFLHASGAWNSGQSPLPTTFISKNQRAVSTRAPSGESFAATTNLRRENQSPNLHTRRIATSAP